MCFFFKSPPSPAGYFSMILTGAEKSFCCSTLDSFGAKLASNISRYSERERENNLSTSFSES
jgi:hypothetical protein